VRGELNGEVAGGRTRRYPRDDPRVEVGEEVRIGVDVGIGVSVGPMEFQLIQRTERQNDNGT